MYMLHSSSPSQSRYIDLTSNIPSSFLNNGPCFLNEESMSTKSDNNSISNINKAKMVNYDDNIISSSKAVMYIPSQHCLAGSPIRWTTYPQTDFLYQRHDISKAELDRRNCSSDLSRYSTSSIFPTSNHPPIFSSPGEYCIVSYPSADNKDIGTHFVSIASSDASLSANPTTKKKVAILYI